jgi:hypothetical protein
MGKKKGGIDALYINETKNFSPNISDVYSETLVYSPSSFKLGGSIIDVNHDYLNRNHTEIDHKYLSTDNLNLNDKFTPIYDNPIIQKLPELSNFALVSGGAKLDIKKIINKHIKTEWKLYKKNQGKL